MLLARASPSGPLRLRTNTLRGPDSLAAAAAVVRSMTAVVGCLAAADLPPDEARGRH